MLDDAALRAIVSQPVPVEQVAEKLIVAALEKTASDNITALVVRFEPDRS
jgi:serine/threonine protein phosphatase PrpC